MIPVLPIKPTGQQMNDGTDVRRRAAREQEFYEECGADSIVDLFRFITVSGELCGKLATMVSRLFSGKPAPHGWSGSLQIKR